MQEETVVNADPQAAEQNGSEKAAPPSRRKKIIRRILIALAVTLVALVIFLLLLLDVTLKTAVCKAGPYFTGTPIRMESLRISPLRGALSMRGFTVGNPEGFSHENIFEMGLLVCDIDMGSLLGPELVVEEVTIQGLMVDYEPSLGKGSNVAQLQQHIESRIGTDKAAGEPEKADSETDAGDSGKPAKKVVIRKLRVEGIELATVGGIKMPLAPIVLNDLGGESVGETINRFMTELLLSVGQVFSKETVNAIGNSLNDAGKAIGNSLNDAGKNLGDSLNDAGKSIGNSLNDAGKNLGDSLNDAGKNIGDSLKGIFAK